MVIPAIPLKLNHKLLLFVLLSCVVTLVVQISSSTKYGRIDSRRTSTLDEEDVAVIATAVEDVAATTVEEEVPTITSLIVEEEQESPSLAVFYHIFVPPNGADSAVKTIVQEQINQLGQLLTNAGQVDHQNNNNKTIALYFNTIGKENVITTKSDDKDDDGYNMNDLCWKQSGFVCKHLQHLPTGHEEFTLQSLHEYCQHHSHHRVLYMHTKGVFHGRQNQAIWRQNMLNSIASVECLNITSSSSCNVCGMQFLPMWSMIFPGNFFTADCGYIKKLIPPRKFATQMDNITDAEKDPSFSLLQHQIYINSDNLPGMLGRGRFANEHWVASHPTIRPCDWAVSSNLAYYWTKNDTSLFDFDDGTNRGGQGGPRHDIHQYRISERTPAKKRVLRDTKQRMKEFSLLPGLMHKWIRLYGEIPPAESWIWKWFPDGEVWQSAFSKYGDRTVQQVLTPL